MSPVRRPPLRVWVWTAATVAVVVVAVLAWRGSDAAATSATTAEAPAAATGTPAPQLREAWTAAPAGPVTRQVVQSGRVLVTGTDGVRLLDPATGEEAWHHTRANARLCGATVVDDLVVVLFSTGGRCNEITALRAATGERAWYRSVGFRADATLTSTTRTVLASSPTGLTTLDPTGNNVRWHHPAPEGCRFDGADVGAVGVVALQRCGDGAAQVVLLDGADGTQRWTRDVGAGARLVGADRLVEVVADGALQVLTPQDGSPLLTVALPASTADPADEPLLQTGLQAADLVWVRGTAYVLDAATGQVRWSVPSLGLPAAADGKASTTSVLVPEETGFVQRDLATGTELGTSATASAPPAGGVAAVVGPTVVLATSGTVTAYR